MNQTMQIYFSIVAGRMLRLSAKLLLLSYGILLSVSCSKSKDAPATKVDYSNGIVAVANDNFSLSLFSTALTNTGYADTLVQSGPYTVLAPSNTAYGAAGYVSGISIIKAYDSMHTMMPYLVIHGRQKLDSLPLAFDQPVTTSGGAVVYITHWVNSRDTAVIVNGVRVSGLDKPASNGLINVLDNIIYPPVFKDVHLATGGDPALSIFNAALVRSGFSDSLASGGPYTVFAPNNAAFMAIGINTTDSIYNMDPVRLQTLVRAHIVMNRSFIYDYILKADVVANTYTETMKDGSSMLISLIPNYSQPGRFTGINLLGSGGYAASLTRSNVLAGNGVLHSIDSLLTTNF
jgi:uncharacterized surface protein with fasciclin (FAS1) repeats